MTVSSTDSTVLLPNGTQADNVLRVVCGGDDPADGCSWALPSSRRRSGAAKGAAKGSSKRARMLVLRLFAVPQRRGFQKLRDFCTNTTWRQQ